MGRVNRLRGWRDADGSEGEDVQPDPFETDDEHVTLIPHPLEFELMKRMARAAGARLMAELFSSSLHDTIQEQWPW